MTDIKIEEALAQLDQIAAALESGNLSLEQAMEQYVQGVQLVKACSRTLSEAKLKIEEMKIN